MEGERDVFSVELMAIFLWSASSSTGSDRLANGANKFKMRGKCKQTRKNSCQCNRWGQMEMMGSESRSATHNKGKGSKEGESRNSTKVRHLFFTHC